MAQAETAKLDSGSVFPDIRLQFAGGGGATIPVDFKGNWVVFIIYRSHR
jgi:hypothetical protein